VFGDKEGLVNSSSKWRTRPADSRGGNRVRKSAIAAIKRLQEKGLGEKGDKKLPTEVNKKANEKHNNAFHAATVQKRWKGGNQEEIK